MCCISKTASGWAAPVIVNQGCSASSVLAVLPRRVGIAKVAVHGCEPVLEHGALGASRDSLTQQAQCLSETTERTVSNTKPADR